MKRIILAISALLIVNVWTTTAVNPTAVFLNDKTKVVITFDSAQTFTQLDYIPTGGSATKFGDCTSSGTVVTCSGVQITVKPASPYKYDVKADNTGTALFSITVNDAQTYSAATLSDKKLDTDLDLSVTVGTAYEVAPTVKASTESKSVDATGCGLDDTKKIVKCKIKFDTKGTYDIYANEVKTSKTVEARGSYLIMSLSLLALVFMF